MSNYELTYILRPLEEANLTATNERINTIVKNAGGEIVARNDWGRRRMAYPIRKISDGYYTTLFATLPGTAVRGIERALQLNDDVLRYLVVRVEEFKLPAAPAAPPAEAQGAAQAAATQPAAQAAVPAPAAETAAQPAAEASAPAADTATAETPAAEPPAASEAAPAPAAEGS